MAKKEVTEQVTETKFSKDRLIRADKFSDRTDVLNAVLVDGKMYTVAEIEDKIDKYMKGKVD